MKKLFVILALIPMLANAQFVVTTNGITTEDGKGFHVIEHEGTQAELYAKVKTALVKLYKNPDIVLNYDEPNSIKVSASFTQDFRIDSYTYTIPAHYTIFIQFKDGKVRMDAPACEGFILDMPTYHQHVYFASGKTRQPAGECYTFNPDGTLHKKFGVAKQIAEDYFNGIASFITKSMDEIASAQDDW